MSLLITCLVLVPGIRPFFISWTKLPSIIVFYLLLGCYEEIFNRGLIQNALLRYGPLQSIILSATLFGLMHLAHLIAGNQSMPDAILQILRATAWGFGASVLRLHTRTIVPLMGLHALTDLFDAVSSVGYSWSWLAQMPIVMQYLVVELPYYLMGLYGLFLLRKVLITPGSLPTSQACV